MDKIGSWFSGLWGQRTPAETPAQPPAVAHAVARATAGQFNPAPPQHPPLPPAAPERTLPAVYQDIEAATTLQQLIPLLKEVQSVISNPAVEIQALNRVDVLLVLYNKLTDANFDGSPKTPETQLFYDKLEQAIYHAYQPEMLRYQVNPDLIDFYSYLFSRVATSPSFAILYKPAEEFFADFARFRQQEHVPPSQSMLPALQHELRYLSLAPTVLDDDGHTDEARVIGCITTYQQITPTDQWKTSDKLAYNLLEQRYGIAGIELLGQSYSIDTLSRANAKSTLRNWIQQASSADVVFNLYHTINSALERGLMSPKDRIELHEELLQKVLVYNSTVTGATKASLECLDAAIRHLSNDLRRGEGLGSVIAAATFQLRAGDLLKALNEIIYKQVLLNADLLATAQRLSADLTKIQSIYEDEADRLAEEKACCRITSRHTQFTLPAIDMRGRETSRDTEHPGRGACLSIAAYTCNSLLRGQLQNVEDLHQAMYCGISRYQDCLGGPEEEGVHLNMENIGVFFRAILDVVRPYNDIEKHLHLKKGEEKTTFLQSLGFMDQLADLRPDKKIAATIRVRGSIFSLFLDRSTGSPLVTVADSHGLEGGAKGKAYVKTFNGLDDAATFLARAYPHQEVSGGPIPGDPLNNGEIEFLALPARGGEPIEEDLAYAEEARTRTGARAYQTPPGREPRFPNPKQEMYGRMFTILTEVGKTNQEKLIRLGREILRPLNDAGQLTGHLKKRRQRGGETQEDYLTYMVCHYTEVARRYMRPTGD